MNLAEELVNKLHIQTEEEEKEELTQEQIKAEELKNKKLESFLNGSNIPKRYFKALVSDLNDEDYIFIREKRFSILKGDLGVGKTYTASAVLIDAFKMAEKESYFLRCYQLKTMDINELKALIKKCEKVGVLLVDDLGMIAGNQFVTELIASMLLTRIDDDLRTIITTNENLATFNKVPGIFDDRIANKLIESFVTRVLEGENKRVRAK
jgi:DNA replication protein DnaC